MIIKEKIKSLLIKVLLGFLFAAPLLYLSYIFLDIIVMLAVSVLLSLIFNPLVSYLENKGISRWISILLIIIIGSSILFSGFSYIIPKITEQISQLSASLSQTKIKSFLNDIDQKITKLIPFIAKGTVSHRIEIFITDFMVNSLDRISNFISSLVSVVAVVVIVPFMTFFMLKDNRTIIKGFINLVPNNYFEMSYLVTTQISKQLGRFVRGWILDAFLVGLLCGFGLAMLGIDNSILIGIVAGIGHLIPYFGPVIGGIPAIIISVIQFGDFSMLPGIIILLLMIYTIDNGLIQPNVYAKSVDMHPLLIIVLMAAGSHLMGIAGLLFAVPLATVIKTAAREIYRTYNSYAIVKNQIKN